MVGGERSRPRGSSLVEVDGSQCGATVETQWRHCGATLGVFLGAVNQLAD